MLLSVQYLRGIAAMLVLLTHMSGMLNGVYARSDLGTLLFGQFFFGVDLFFVISGFVMCLASEKRESHAAVKFIIRRFFRLYPLMIVSVIVYAILLKTGHIHEYGEPTPHNILKSLLPLHLNYLAAPPFFGYNLLPPVWTLSYEVTFYALFLLAIILCHRARLAICSALIAALFIGGQLVFGQEVSLNTYRLLCYPDTLMRPLLAIVSSPMMIDFLYGILAYTLYRYLHLTRSRFTNACLLLVFGAALLLLCSGILMPSGSTQPSFLLLHGPKHWGLIALLLVSTFALYEKNNTLPGISALIILGDISYSLYITQFIWFKILPHIPLMQHIQGFSQFILSGLIITFSSWLTFHLIEKPCIHLSRKVIARLN